VTVLDQTSVDPTSAGDYWGFVQWSHTNGNGFYYLRDRQVLRWQTKKSTYTNPYADIAIAESALADSEWHILTVCEDEDGKVTAILDGATVGTATFSTVANMDGLVAYVAGGVPIPKQYMKLDGSTPYWPESGGTYASNGAAKMDLAYLSLGDESYAHDDGAATTLAFAQLANAEGMHHLGISTDTLKRRYWAIDFDGVTKLGTTSHLEIGAVWLGDRRDIEVQAGASVNLSDPSKVAQSYGGTVYLDRQTPFRTANVSVEQLTLANAYALQSELATAGGREVVVDLHSSSSDATLRDSGAIYGRAGASPASATLSSGSGSTVALQITESRK